MKKKILCIVVLLFVFSDFIYTKIPQYQYPKKIGTQQGLASTKVNSIVQDHKGIIWIGTEDGLNKYDGYHFSRYKRIDGDIFSLSNNNVKSVFSDSEGNLWVGTMMGLQCYNRQKDHFTQVTLGQSKEMMIKNSFLRIVEDSKKNVWFSIYNLGVLKYSLINQNSILYKSLSDGGKISSKSVRDIMEDRDGNIWFTSFDQGITIYNPKQDSFRYLNTANKSLPTNSILRVCELKNGNIALATLGMGLYILNPKDYSFTKTNLEVTTFAVEQMKDGTVVIGTEGKGLYYIDPSDNKVLKHPAISSLMSDINSSKMHCILEDFYGNLWVGMYNDGICYLPKEPDGFVNYKRSFDNSNSLSYGQIAGITKDNKGNIWFATDGGGLNMLNLFTGKYTHYRHDASDSKSLPDDAVVSVFKDSKGIIWAGTYIGGLCRFDNTSGKFVSYQHIDGKNSVSDNYVKCIVEDDKHNLWLGTDGGGISYFDRETETFTNYSAADNEGLVLDNVTCLFLQNDRTLWVGTHAGICRLDIASGKFRGYGNGTSVNNLTIYSINQDKDGTIWLGTTSGLYRYNPQTDSFQSYSLSERFRDLVINSIVPYKDQLWLSTNEGIICYAPKLQEIQYFLSNNDLGGTNFIRSSYYISPDREIFFGAGDGCYAFHPDKLNLGKGYAPNVYITNLEIFNEPIFVGKPYKKHIILQNALEYTEAITLRYSENSFTLRFASPDIKYPSSVYYMCFMEGVDKQWVAYPHTQQSVSYANLSPGKYIFHVYASNISNQKDKNVTTLLIEVLPPFWLTWWAKAGYVMLGLLALGGIMWISYVRMKDKNELEMERLRAKEQEELSRNKMQFFTNISHEFRTPLTLIIAPLQEIHQSETDKERAHILKMMLRNANRLLRLINQILDLRKAENNKIEIKVRPINLIGFVQDFIGIFSDVVHRKNISLSLDYNSKDIEVWYDPDLLEKCLYNLLSNGIKYTEDSGKIHISIYKKPDNNVILSITDNGSGIDKTEQPYLFDRFYQGEYSKGEGTGIGLHLVKTIVELHHGSVSVDSELGKGSCFMIRIFAGHDHFNPDECNPDEWTPPDIEREQVRSENIADEDMLKEESLDTKSKPLILLVEDEVDMRMYIRHELQDQYQIEDVTNGREALAKLRAIHPDLIITDVMMPEMDGIEFTRIVKENIDTCHVPVILLTANGEIEQKLEGLETGADSYIVKPFRLDYLKIRVKKLLDIRKKMQERFIRMINLEPHELDVTNADEVLLQNSISYIRDNISKTDLSVEEMARDLNMSRTNLHRKMKTLIGQSPVELIRSVRMKQAAYLLENSTLSISEIAYGVGYNSLSYFSSSFNSYWGVSPSAYIKNKQEKKE